jgi:DNA-binding response OmpR family regulator
MSIALNILIVEDEALIAMGYEALAIEAGHKVTAIARDTASAFAQAQTLKPDVALVDLRLTDGVTGNAIALGLRERHDVRAIIMITGNVSDLSHEARDISIAVLAKLISRVELTRALDTAAAKTNRHP